MNKGCRTTLLMPERYKVMNPKCSGISAISETLRSGSKKRLGLDVPIGVRKNYAEILEAFSLLNRPTQLWD